MHKLNPKTAAHKLPNGMRHLKGFSPKRVSNGDKMRTLGSTPNLTSTFDLLLATRFHSVGLSASHFSADRLSIVGS